MTKQKLSSSVRPWKGAPTLFINGKPDTGLMLYHAHVSKAREEIASFAQAGIDLFTTDIGSTHCLRRDGLIDPSEIDSKMTEILAGNPEAKVLARIALHPPEWWVNEHPEEMMIHRDPFMEADVRGEYDCVSFASQLWRNEMGSALRQVIRHMEDRWSGHLLGYHLAGGECGEWSYLWRHYTQSDYSAPQQSAFRRWLREVYQGDEARFAQAWGGIGFDQAEVPEDWRWTPERPQPLSDPADQPLKDYLRFHSEVVAEAALYFSQLTKEELRRLGAEKVVALFYGYSFTPPGNPSAYTDSGHHALERVLRSPDVDILCAPYSYYGREHGGYYYSQLPSASVRLHGKLLFSEEDTVTHVAGPHPHRYHCPDGWTSRQVILRNVLGALRDGGTAWYMDWFGWNWYRDPELLASFAATQQFAKQRLDREKESVAEIAVFTSETIMSQLRPIAPAYVPWVLESVADLHRLGAPVDLFLLPDLPRALASRLHTRYKALIFLSVLNPSPAEQAAIDAAEKSGIALLWSHPEGIPPAGRGEHFLLPLEIKAVREFCVRAGVHLYSDQGDFVMAERDWVAVHAASEGVRDLKLPPNVSMGEEENLTGDATTALFLRKGETRVWRLDRAGDPS